MKNSIEVTFSYHRPTSEKAAVYESLRAAAKTLAYLYDDLCPVCREKSLATTKLEESIMWANAAVARDLTQEEITRERSEKAVREDG